MLRLMLVVSAVFALVVFNANATIPQNGGVSLWMPGLPWSLEISEPGFRVVQKEVSVERSMAHLSGERLKDGVLLTVFIEKAKEAGDSEICRKYYMDRMKNSPLKMDSINEYAAGSMAIAEYFIREYAGVDLKQKHIHAYLVKEGYWLDVHLSVSDCNPDCEKQLQSIVKHIGFNDAFAPSVWDYIDLGNQYFWKNDMKTAAIYYQDALDMEKSKATLQRKDWIVLVDQLGMSYGISGNLEAAAKLYEWALKKEPEYPMFYYNMACVCAETGDMQGILKYLKKAFTYKANMLPGEVIPDPMNDDSFKKYLEDPSFRATIEKLKE